MSHRYSIFKFQIRRSCDAGEVRIFEFRLTSLVRMEGVNKHSTGPTGPHRTPPRPTGPHRDPPGPTGTYQAPPRPTRHPSEALLADSNPVQQGLKLGNRALPGPHRAPPDPTRLSPTGPVILLYAQIKKCI